MSTDPTQRSDRASRRRSDPGSSRLPAFIERIRRTAWPLLLGLSVFIASLALALYAGSVRADTAVAVPASMRLPAAWLVGGLIVLIVLAGQRARHTPNAVASDLYSTGSTGVPERDHPRSTLMAAGAAVSRGEFMLALRRHWKNCLKQSSCLTLVQLEIDDSHRICDEFGHRRFESCLDGAGQSLASLVESRGGLITRNGDDSEPGFLALFPNTTPDDALHAAEDMCQAIEDLGIDLPGDRHGIMTASAGVCVSVPSSEINLRQLFHSTLEAGDRARKLGSNRVAVNMLDRDNALLGNQSPRSSR